MSLARLLCCEIMVLSFVSCKSVCDPVDALGLSYDRVDGVIRVDGGQLQSTSLRSDVFMVDTSSSAGGLRRYVEVDQCRELLASDFSVAYSW